MTSEIRAAIHAMANEPLCPSKIAIILSISHFSVRYVLDANGERAKSHARVRRWRAAKKAQQ
jgi:hypothetical protein